MPGFWRDAENPMVWFAGVCVSTVVLFGSIAGLSAVHTSPMEECIQAGGNWTQEHTNIGNQYTGSNPVDRKACTMPEEER